MPRLARRSKPEPTIALINIVFLMLIFFMVAGTLAEPMDPDIKLIETRDLDGQPPAHVLVITPTGALHFQGEPQIDVSRYLGALDKGAPARLLPDRSSPAGRVIEVANMLRAQGVERVVLVTEQALK